MKRYVYILIAFAFALTGCTSHPTLPKEFVVSDTLPTIFPDYTNITVPCNIAPLNFMAEGAEKCIAHVHFLKEEQTYGEKNFVQIPLDDWQEMLDKAKGDTIFVDVYTQIAENEKWTRYKRFFIAIAPEEIDPYISYRLISPSYIGYEMLSINQRNLTNFDETVIYNNELASTEEKGQCINCHAYQNYRTDNMQFHIRQALGGTMIVNDGTPKKVSLRTEQTISAGVYPSWHPTEKLIAYSTNITGQSFHTKDLAKIEVQDGESDLILYDVEKNEITTVSCEPDELETYPAWSPDGKTLYYASAHFVFNVGINRDLDAIYRYKEIKYDLYRRSFDPQSRRFGEKELVYPASANGQSATLPRISPDGRYMLFSMGEWGCFHIWHPDADLYITDLQSGETRRLEHANSPQAESYHTWSSNGRWILFSSRRDDGNYTRLCMAYFDEKGQAHKAFELPQRNPEFYKRFLRSYNIPEFMTEPVKVSPQEFASVVKKEAEQTKHAVNKVVK